MISKKVVCGALLTVKHPVHLYGILKPGRLLLCYVSHLWYAAAAPSYMTSTTGYATSNDELYRLKVESS